MCPRLSFVLKITEQAIIKQCGVHSYNVMFLLLYCDCGRRAQIILSCYFEAMGRGLEAKFKPQTFDLFTPHPLTRQTYKNSQLSKPTTNWQVQKKLLLQTGYSMIIPSCTCLSSMWSWQRSETDYHSSCITGLILYSHSYVLVAWGICFMPW